MDKIGQYGQNWTIWTILDNLEKNGQDGSLKIGQKMDKIGQYGQLKIA